MQSISRSLEILNFADNTSNFRNVAHHYISNVSYAFDVHKLFENDITILQNTTPSSILHYVSWHIQNRKCFEMGSCQTENVKALVWKCPKPPKKCAGVGDRLRGIQFAFLLAVITKRMFFIQWPDDPYPLLEALIPATFNWNLPTNVSTQSWSILSWFTCIRPRPCTEGILPSDENLPPPNGEGPDINILSDDIPLRLNDYGHMVITARPRPQTVWNLMNNSKSIKNIIDLNYISRQIDIQRSLLKLIFKPSGHVQNYMSKLIPDKVRTSGYVSIHARTGLDVQEGHSVRFINLNNDLANTANLMLTCALMMTNGTLKNVFLASDSAKFEKIFNHLARKKKVEVFYSPIPTMHVDYAKLGYYHNMTEYDRWTSFINVFVDFFGVSQGRALITNGSGFSRMAFNYGHASTLVELGRILDISQCTATNI